MLIVRLMGKCNNRCTFCMVHDEMSGAVNPSFEEITKKILKLPPNDQVDLFGGEPTLYPFFEETILLCKYLNHEVYIATNGRTFSDKSFARKIAGYGVNQIRTSLYGHNCDIHDYHTNVQGSFSETIDGIKNILEYSTDLLVNIVMTRKNANYLSNMVVLLSELRVQKVKFSSLIKSQRCKFLVPSFNHIREALSEALTLATSLGMRCEIEKSPLCLAPKYQENYIHEPHDRLVYSYTEKCNKSCTKKEDCIGIPIEQYLLFGDSTVNVI